MKVFFIRSIPMGFCGVPFENDGIQRHEIKRVEEWIPHMQKLGVNAVYFSPVFESDTHGYNTRDYRKIDVRLEPMKILRKYVTHCMRQESGLC